MSLETLLEAAQYIEVETDEDGRTRVKTASNFPHQSHAYAKVKTEQVLLASSDQPVSQQISVAQHEIVGGNIVIPGENTSPAFNAHDRVPRVIGSGTRDLHNKLEKNRRAHLKDCFENLRKQIPNFDDIKASNLSILRNAVRTIQQLQRKEKELEIEMQRLAREKIMSQERISILRMELAAMNIEYDLSHFMESNDPENHSSSTATAEEMPGGVSEDEDDRRSSSTLSTTSPNTSGTALRSPAYPTSPAARSAGAPSGATSSAAMHSILNRAVLSGTQHREDVAVKSEEDEKPPAKSITQLLQQAIYQRQEHLKQQQTASTVAAVTAQRVGSNASQAFLTSASSPSTSHRPHKRSRSRKDSSQTLVSGGIQPISIQPLVKQIAEPVAPPASSVTLNQLLPSRFPPVLNPATIVNPIDLNTLIKLTGAQLVSASKPSAPLGISVVTTSAQGAAATGLTSRKEVTVAPVATAASLQPAMTSLQSAMVANALLVSAAQSAQPAAAAVRPLQNSELPGVATVTTTQATPQTPTLASALLGSAPQPVQLITPQQLQQLILQATLQQQLQQQLAQQLQQVAVDKGVAATLKPAPVSTGPAPSTSRDVSQSQPTTTVTPITMPTIPLNQLLQPITDLSAAMSPAVQLTPANLQQTLATAQLNQVVMPQMLKTLGQLPLLQQPTLTVPVMVTMPSVLPPVSQAPARATAETSIKKE